MSYNYSYRVFSLQISRELKVFLLSGISLIT